MKSFLISIHPGWIIKIFNGDKTAEIRRTAPKEWKDYLFGKTKIKPEPMTGYIYCTDPNAKETLSLFAKEAREHHGRVAEFIERKRVDNPDMRWSICNGKVIAKFVLREMEAFYYFDDELCHRACLDRDQMADYLGDKLGYAWHISNLQIFDKPKELSDFMIPDIMTYSQAKELASKVDENYTFEKYKENCAKLNYCIKRPPQDWRYVDFQCGE